MNNFQVFPRLTPSAVERMELSVVVFSPGTASEKSGFKVKKLQDSEPFLRFGGLSSMLSSFALLALQDLCFM